VSGKKKGKPINFVDTGELKSRLRVQKQADGKVVIVAPGQGVKIRNLEKRFGPVFQLSVEEKNLLK
jgi:hypothetical protein